MLTDIEIASGATLKPVAKIAATLGINECELEPYGRYKAKIAPENVSAGIRPAQTECGGCSGAQSRLILVTAVNPTPAGEGKTTVSIGLAQGFAKIGKRTVLALREPSLGPVFGVKGGAAGGGYSQVLPMEDINLHFTGDLHAITAANNLLCALLDNHIQQGNALGIDQRRVRLKRCIDMNDRSLRNIVIGLGGKIDGIPRQDGFIMTVASEVMAILCLADDLADLKRRLGKILVGYNYSGDPVYAEQLDAVGAMAALLKDAVNPNLVQSIEGVPALIHGGPFANIAHGCNSVRATKLAMRLCGEGGYVVTEAGFGSDLGAEKFFNIKCRSAGLTPACAVLVATVRALKYNGGVARADLATPDVAALERGIVNLQTHIENLHKFGVPVVVAINKFHTDSDEEIAFIEQFCFDMNVVAVTAEVFSKGGEGGIALAEAVDGTCAACRSQFAPLYELDTTLKQKLDTVAREIYRADGVDYTSAAEKNIAEIERLGYGNVPVCVAKTQYSLSDDPTKLGSPRGFRVTVREVRLAAGAGFAVALTGDIMTLPGLPKVPAANNINIDDNGDISGLF